MDKDDKLNIDLKNKSENDRCNSLEHCSNYGEINFRQNKTKKNIRFMFKGISFVLIAAVSGGISASYIIEKRYSKIIYGMRSNNSIIYSNGDENLGKTAVIPKDGVNNIVEELNGTIVAVSAKLESFSRTDIDKSMGSGIIFDSNGYIVTNSTTVNGVDKVYVKLASYGAKPMEAKLIGIDATSDIAVIKIEAENLPVAKFADSDKVRSGELAVAVGNPLGEDISTAVTVGIISMTNRKIEAIDPKTSEKSSYGVLKTDATINAYNTGGALCNSLGEVIGINSFKLSSQYSSEGMSIAICSNDAKHIMQSLTNYGKVKKPHLGYVGQSVGQSSSDKYQGIEGVYIREVTPGESLDNAGVRPTDIIVELDGNTIKKYQDIQPIIDGHKIGDTISCKIWRDGNILSLQVVLTEKK